MLELSDCLHDTNYKLFSLESHRQRLIHQVELEQIRRQSRSQQHRQPGSIKNSKVATVITAENSLSFFRLGSRVRDLSSLVSSDKAEEALLLTQLLYYVPGDNDEVAKKLNYFVLKYSKSALK